MGPSITLAAVSHMSKNKEYRLCLSAAKFVSGSSDREEVGAGAAHWLTTKFQDDAVAGGTHAAFGK